MPEEKKEAASKEEEKQEEGKEDETLEEKVVSLSETQYNKLMDRVAELEDAASKTPRKDELDELAEEGRSRQGRGEDERKGEEIDFENMSNSQLAQTIIDKVNEAGRPLIVDIETLKVLREIDRCERDHEDFHEYEKDIRAIAMQKPSLSIEDAYVLAKVAKSKKASDKTEKRETVTERLIGLPKRSFPAGERSGVAVSTTRGVDGVKTMKDAATKAWDKVMGSKTEIPVD